MAYKAVVIGLGKIGIGYDLRVPASRAVQTHAQGFQAHPGFKLVGAMDTRAEPRRAFSKKFGVPSFARIEALLAATRPEIVSLAVPTPLHGSALDEVLRLS